MDTSRCCSFDKTFKIWNTDNVTLVKTLSGHTHFIYSLILLENECLASAGVDRVIRIWNTTSYSLEKNITGHLGYIINLTTLKMVIWKVDQKIIR